ncbi:putative HTH-type transcriptional regulator ywbI [Proteiniborus sp. DW1]|uniref:LysR family transcriptional regulator n=1 Tax=Proteiniborus sp. DW1 TaxID=1889883 RepID=UPI00092E06FA|nr:LysR family transcriptional regulator [Proteiniborus sp. DW1]SCG82890.1 putative HTH-type transcriptional regulator ywbI [Proteiniborus sp. DW1]
MNYNILRYIITVAEEGSFTKAAKKLYIAQPSLSQIIKNEEKKLGVFLFNRSNNPITLTDAGHEYILWARQIISLYENMERSLQDFSKNEASVLQIGILPECSAFILPAPLKAFREANPKRLVQIHELSSNDIQKLLENSEVDFIIGLTHPDTFTYCSEPLYDEKIVLAVTPEFSPANKDVKEVDLADFADAPFVMMEEGQFLYNVTHELCKRSGYVPRAVVECYNLETAMHMVKAGVGIAIIPDLMSRLVGGLNYYDIKGLTPQSQISVVYRRDRHLPKEARELIELIKKNANK